MGGFLCIVVPNVIFFIIYSRRKEFKEALQLANRMTKGKIKFLRKYEHLPQAASAGERVVMDSKKVQIEENRKDDQE